MFAVQKGVPAALTVPSSQWFAENNFTALPVVVVPALGFYGYGDIRVTPIVRCDRFLAYDMLMRCQLYTLTYITLDVLEVFVGINSVNLTGTSSFANVPIPCLTNSCRLPCGVAEVRTDESKM